MVFEILEKVCLEKFKKSENSEKKRHLYSYNVIKPEFMKNKIFKKTNCQFTQPSKMLCKNFLFILKFKI